MQGLNDVIERAFELARSGTCRHPTDVRLRLRMEGFSHVDLFISGPSLEADLNRLCHTASDERIKESHVEEVKAAGRPVAH
ncbi:hypothetical protein PY365_04220 [Roseiarcaceae bacterium H3SJ34-1]|uniref:hypothetical protein n=1 Tax=Terripilifer ovatus TaxID=3032367 RepID=UPI003AB95EBD|nr:hypothetical protein [Roseiarcaceae bacterium H3SJ34-1]